MIPKKFGDPILSGVSCAREALVLPLWVFLGPLFFSLEMMGRGSRSLGTSQRQQKLDLKTAGSAASQSIWNMTATRPKKVVLYGVLGMWWLGWGWDYGCRSSTLMMIGRAGQDVDLWGGRSFCVPGRQMRAGRSTEKSGPSFGRLGIQPWESRTPEGHITWGVHTYFTLQKSSVCKMTFFFI